MPTKTAYTSGHFLFNLDDSPTTSWLKSVDGGTVKGSVVTENVGPDAVQVKHLSTIEIEPLSLELGMAATSPVFRWIQDSWKRNFSRRNGSIVHADFNYKAVLEQSFTGALIAETTFPALDATDNNPAYLTVKLHPERLVINQGGGQSLQSQLGNSKEKMWSPAMFRVEIDGVDCTMVQKVDSITVKQKIKQLYTGSNRYPELEPTGIEFPNITLYLAAAYAQDFITWHRQFVIDGDKELKQEKQGAIEFRDPSNKNAALFTLDLKNVGISSLSIEKSEGNAEAIKRCKVELYVDSLDLQYGEGFE